MHFHPAVFTVDMQRTTIMSLHKDCLRQIFELSYKRPQMQRHYYSVRMRFDMPLMGVNKWCKKTMDVIFAMDFDNIKKIFEEHVLDFARVYLFPTNGCTPTQIFSLDHFMRDGTCIEVEAAWFRRGEVFEFEDEESTCCTWSTSALFIQYKLACQGAGRRFDMRWKIPFDDFNGFDLAPALREQEDTENVDRIIGEIQEDMRAVFANPREILEERSDDEDSDWDSDEETQDHEMTRMSSDEMLENELDREPPDSEEEIEDLLDQAADLRDMDSV